LPRLVKGGKYVYGWSQVGYDGKIVIPDEALTEYSLKSPTNVMVLSGSKRSGGFALTTIPLLQNSALSRILDENPELASFQLPEGETIKVNGKPLCWTTLNEGCIVLPSKTLQEYGINHGDRLLSVRGSSLALAFCVKGPLIDEAKKHPNLAVLTLQ
jgi:hypothetical protein